MRLGRPIIRHLAVKQGID